MIEMVLVIMIIKTVIFDVPDFHIVTPSIYVYICRFLTSFLLHMELTEDVK
jgi:hypothetical protein